MTIARTCGSALVAVAEQVEGCSGGQQADARGSAVGGGWSLVGVAAPLRPPVSSGSRPRVAARRVNRRLTGAASRHTLARLTRRERATRGLRGTQDIRSVYRHSRLFGHRVVARSLQREMR